MAPVAALLLTIGAGGGLKQTLWVWSVLQTLVSATGLAGTLLLSL
ncbi:hypothetical protein [uncultured Pseudomonas sp.]|nr:hypothetical protein [uncultured Pseudomonas sp.]